MNYANQTEVGKIFGIDSHTVAKYLTKLGLKHNNQPTDLAKRANICKKSKVWLWDKHEIIKLFSALGLKKRGAAKNNEKKVRNLPKDRMIAYLDGSICTYAVVLFDKNNVKSYIAGKKDVGNNNRAELMAAHAVLSILPEKESITLISDSLYVKKVLDNIELADKNLDIVEPIKVSLAEKKLDVKVIWIKSHAGLAGNEEADSLANFVKFLTEDKLK